MVRQQIFIGAALLAGVAAGYFLRESGTSDTARAATAVPVHEGVRGIADKGAEATIAALRARIAELERGMADGATEAKAPVGGAGDIADGATESKAPDGRDGGRLRDPREWLDRMKREDPGRYTETTNRWAHFRAERKARSRSSLDMLASVDTSRMSASAKESHLRYQELMMRREELEERMHDAFENDGATEEQRREMFREMGEVSRELMGASKEERTNLFTEMAESLGFRGDEAAEITDTISDIIEATEQFGPRGFGRGGRRGPGGPGGGR